MESIEVEAKSRVVHVDEEAAAMKANEAQALKSECENDLAEALPALEAALTALDTLKVSYISQHIFPSRSNNTKKNTVFLQPSDISIVKAMKNPPSGVKLVMAAVCVMKNVKPDRIPDPAGTGKKVRPGIFQRVVYRYLFHQNTLSFEILCILN